jgi:hypothetical protein
MGISQQIGASSLIKAGVCTSATRPATPYEGQVIFETDTDKLLVWNGTAWVIPNSPAQNPGGLELVTPTSVAGTGVTQSGATVLFSGASSVSVNGCFTSLYDHYKIIVNNFGSVVSFTRWRLRAGGTDAVGANYFRYGFTTVYTSGSLTIYNGGTESSFVPCTSYGNSATGSGTSELFVSMPFANNAYTMTSTDCNDSNAGQIYKLNGTVNATTSFDGFTIYPNGGTITGTLQVFGYRKS